MSVSRERGRTSRVAAGVSGLASVLDLDLPFRVRRIELGSRPLLRRMQPARSKLQA